jgi:hypothetical protein
VVAATTLSLPQQDLVASLVQQLRVIPGVRAVVLGGSHARGCAQPTSDIDLGIFYSEGAPFSIDAVRKLAVAVNDDAAPVVTDFYEWGPWVNGGAWLTIGGQRVDFLYRSLEHVERVITAAAATMPSSRRSDFSAPRTSVKLQSPFHCSIPKLGSPR